MNADFLFPFVSLGAPLFLFLWLIGFVFSIIMLIHCLRRNHDDFQNTFTKSGEYEKVIWAALIILSFYFFFVGAILYYFVVKRGESREASKEEGS